MTYMFKVFKHGTTLFLIFVLTNPISNEKTNSDHGGNPYNGILWAK